MYNQHTTPNNDKWPADFNAAAYLHYNPDVAKDIESLSQHGVDITANKLARLHYRANGHAEGRIYTKIPTVITSL